ISDPLEGVAQDAATTFGIPRWTLSASAVITDPDVDAVVICSPTGLHAAQIEEAAAHKKHIFCEKPIDLTLATVNKAIEAVRLLTLSCLSYDDNEHSCAQLMTVYVPSFHSGGGGRRQADGGLQPALRRQLPARARRHRARRGRQAEYGAHHEPGPKRAAHRVPRDVGRHVPRHDDPRLRHGALPRGRRRHCGRGLRDGAECGPSDRSGGRHRHGRGAAALRERRDLLHREQPRGGVRLRPARRGAGLQGLGGVRQPLRQQRRGLDAPRGAARRAAALLPRTLRGRVRGRDGGLHPRVLERRRARARGRRRRPRGAAAGAGREQVAAREPPRQGRRGARVTPDVVVVAACRAGPLLHPAERLGWQKPPT
ncbi:hypothetical protein PybrP1_001662, partial [[Pythium] brassicae (nom. inval.)]